jgi:hypothetical protein
LDAHFTIFKVLEARAESAVEQEPTESVVLRGECFEMLVAVACTLKIQVRCMCNALSNEKLTTEFQCKTPESSQDSSTEK